MDSIDRMMRCINDRIDILPEIRKIPIFSS